MNEIKINMNAIIRLFKAVPIAKRTEKKVSKFQKEILKNTIKSTLPITVIL